MLTDEELMDIRNRAKLNDNRQIDPMAFARAIERAVLAKAMPIPKQEPEIAFQFKHIDTGQIKSVSLSYEEIQEKLTDDLYDELGATICQCESIGETNVVECNCESYFEKFELTGYVPVPAQAAAIPDGYCLAPKEPTASMLDAGVAMALQVSVHGEGGWSKYLRGLYKQMLSASTKPE